MNKQEEGAHASQIVSAKENLKLSYGGPSQGQASGTKKRCKPLQMAKLEIYR